MTDSPWDNFTQLVEIPTTQPEKGTQLSLYSIVVTVLGSIIIALNFAVVISSGLILRRGHRPKSTYLLLGNVAVADLVTAVAIIFGALYPKQDRTEGFCSLQIGMIVSSTLVSIFSVGLIAADRFLYILYGLQYQHWVYPSRVRLAILIAWSAGLLVGFLPAMGWRGFTDGGRICWFILLAPGPLILMTTFLGVFPVLSVLIMYSIILHRALKKVIQLREANEQQTIRNLPTSDSEVQTGPNGLRIFRGGSNLANQDLTLSLESDSKSSKSMFDRFFRGKRTGAMNKPPAEPVSKLKAVRVVILTTGSFTLTWLPYFIACSVYLHCDKDPEEETFVCKNLRFAIASPLALLGFANSLLNPLIYAWWHKGFRRALCRSCKSRSTIHNQNANQRPSLQQNQHSTVTRGSSISSGTTTSSVNFSTTDF